MTPAEQYASKRAESIAIIEKLTPQRLRASFIEMLRPAIAIRAVRAEDKTIAIGASKFGGVPDVPDGFEWPHWEDAPLNFVAQISLEETTALDAGNLLPSSGVLSFFYYEMNSEEEEPYLVSGLLEEKGAWRTFHFTSPLKRTTGPLGWHREFGSVGTAKIAATLAVDFPRYAEELEHGNAEAVAAFEAVRNVIATDSLHVMLGYPFPMTERDARYHVAETTGRGTYRDWVMLFQVNTDRELDYNWGDAGAMFYFIHRDDLKAGDFSKVWLIGES